MYIVPGDKIIVVNVTIYYPNPLQHKEYHFYYFVRVQCVYKYMCACTLYM